MSGGTETRDLPKQETVIERASLLDSAIAATKQTEPDRTEELLRTLTQEALEGTVTFSRNLTVTLTMAMAEIDAKISKPVVRADMTGHAAQAE